MHTAEHRRRERGIVKGEEEGERWRKGKREVWMYREEEVESCGCVVEHIEREGRERRRQHRMGRKLCERNIKEGNKENIDWEVLGYRRTRERD